MIAIDLSTGDSFPLSSLPPLSAALGNFDGVHLGHAAVLTRASDEAQRLGLTPAVWTFDPIPAAREHLCGREERFRLFREQGIRLAVCASFEEVKKWSPERFVRRCLLERCSVRAAACGYNYRFGKDAAGTPEQLASLLSEQGIPLSVVPACTADGEAISSSRIRSLILSGDVAEAAKLLGRPYFVTAPVVRGNKLGRLMGFPTINQEPPEGICLPGRGVYATAVSTDGVLYPAVTNIGTRPTVTGDSETAYTMETHMIGYSGNLYGKTVSVLFRYRQRGEKHFSDLEELIAEIRNNAEDSARSFADVTATDRPSEGV
ncbi:MAG: riboflavin biosynthesis protein RibF [Clostridia bacterium]|nr:riboflavin biosynthesis protein RibF [Clostridia bacterium]